MLSTISSLPIKIAPALLVLLFSQSCFLIVNITCLIHVCYKTLQLNEILEVMELRMIYQI